MASKMNKKELYEAYKKLKGEYMKELVCQGAPTDYQEKLEQLEYTNQILEETISELREQVSDLNECISMMKDEQDENIQLKKENEKLKETIKKYEERYGGLIL